MTPFSLICQTETSQTLKCWQVASCQYNPSPLFANVSNNTHAAGVTGMPAFNRLFLVWLDDLRILPIYCLVYLAGM